MATVGPHPQGNMAKSRRTAHCRKRPSYQPLIEAKDALFLTQSPSKAAGNGPNCATHIRDSGLERGPGKSTPRTKIPVPEGVLRVPGTLVSGTWHPPGPQMPAPSSWTPMDIFGQFAISDDFT